MTLTLKEKCELLTRTIRDEADVEDIEIEFSSTQIRRALKRLSNITGLKVNILLKTFSSAIDTMSSKRIKK